MTGTQLRDPGLAQVTGTYIDKQHTLDADPWAAETMGGTMKKEKTVYKTATVEAALGGWIVRIGNSPAQVFVRWERVVQILEENLTSKGDAQ